MIYRFNNNNYSTFPEYKQALQQSTTRTNAYKTWTKQDDERLLLIYTSTKVREIANEFKRTIGAIKKRIEKLTNKEHNVNTEGFLKAIQNGADPITGEVLAPDSIYLHPKFLEDIKLFFKN